ncbi:ww domain containing protein [Stylonychia lemnae]|uniref:Ww domain containing protein n=1 Tax=Stylonychia lemnae TaxID=5949 RepID=A0A078A9Y3_STYLE|nr:ww domain containing protein [Stylonychia lemnae]|eukprot:CDW78999.1 ww domain containing protein [Stylonychia lemnae]
MSPTDEDIIAYGPVIGLDFEVQDRHLKWIGKQAIQADLPQGWRVFQLKDGQILYFNTLSNEYTLQHPLDPYFQLLAVREKFFHTHGVLNVNYRSPPNSNVIVSTECIEKANQVFYDLFTLKQELSNDSIKLIHERQEQLERQYDRILQQMRHQSESEQIKVEDSILQQFSQRSKETQDKLKFKHQQEIERIQLEYQQGLMRKIKGLQQQAQRNNGNQEEFRQLIQDIKFKQEEKYERQKQFIMDEHKQQRDQLKKRIKNDQNKLRNEIIYQYKERWEQLQSQFQIPIQKLLEIINKDKNLIKIQNAEKLRSEKTALQRYFEEQLDSIKDESQDILNKQKQHLTNQYNQILMQSLSNLDQSKISFDKDIEYYKRQKEQEIKSIKNQIQLEFELKLEKIKSYYEEEEKQKQMGNVMQYIQGLRDHNGELRNQLEQLESNQKQNMNIDWNGDVGQSRSQGISNKNNQRKKENTDFITIGDIDQVNYRQDQNQQINQNNNEDMKQYFSQDLRSQLPQKNLSQEFNKLQNITKPPLSKSPTPSRGSSNLSFISQNIGPSLHINQIRGQYYKSQTPSAESSQVISAKVLNFTDMSPGGISMDIIDRYQMKEIRQFVANELFKTQERTQKLYKEFTQTKQLKEEIREINRRTDLASLESNQAKVKIVQTNHDLEVQFNILRQQIKNLQAKNDILLRIKENLKKHSNSLTQHERQNFETEILNDYNYLRNKTRQDNERAKQSLNSSALILNQTPESSDITQITGQTEYDRHYQKWEKIIKSGTGENQLNFFNEYAVAMLPKEDLGIKTINRLQKALKDLSNMPKLDKIDGQKQSTDYRIRMFKQNEDRQKSRGIQKVIESQFQFLKEIKMELNRPIEIIR